jgi:hypothetical protein
MDETVCDNILLRAVNHSIDPDVIEGSEEQASDELGADTDEGSEVLESTDAPIARHSLTTSGSGLVEITYR